MLKQALNLFLDNYHVEFLRPTLHIHVRISSSQFILRKLQIEPRKALKLLCQQLKQLIEI